MSENCNMEAFLTLVRSGLWEMSAKLQPYGEPNYMEVLRIAQNQAVVGLVAAGMEHVEDIKIPKENVLQFIGQTLKQERRNVAMNGFIKELIGKLSETEIYPLLVKGQGVAQCYERPMWRTSGDVDLLLHKEDYRKAKNVLLPLSSYNKQDERYSMHLGMNIGQWSVEIHGTLRTGLSTRIDKEIDSVQENSFRSCAPRVWHNIDMDILIPSPNNDVFFVFTHFVKHFYKEGVCLRQLCDWCRLLWTYRENIDVLLLEQRLHKAGLLSEWRAFAALAVDYLGMPAEAMPLYESDARWSRKGTKVLTYIMTADTRHKYRDTFTIAMIFPVNTLRFLPSILFNLNWLKVKERIVSIWK